MSVYYNPELYHYGVKGMKWGHRKAQKLEGRTERKYKRAGIASGKADYYREVGAKKRGGFESAAKAFDKTAAKYDKSGNHIKAELARKSASGIRKAGNKAAASYEESAKYYEKKASKLTEKASTYATKKRVDLGKNRIDSILSDSKAKGYKYGQAQDEFRKAQDRAEILDTFNEYRHKRDPRTGTI